MCTVDVGFVISFHVSGSACGYGKVAFVGKWNLLFGMSPGPLVRDRRLYSSSMKNGTICICCMVIKLFIMLL